MSGLLSSPATAPDLRRHGRRATISTNSACTRRSPVSSGWKLVARRDPWRTATILPSPAPPTTRPSTSTPGPASSTHGARMKTAGTGSPPSPAPDSCTRDSNESTCRPNALRRTVTSSPPRVCWPAGASSRRSASRIIPAQEPYTGSPARTAARSGSMSPKRTASLPIVVDSPPGSTRPSTAASSSGRRTGTAIGALGGQRGEVLADVALQRQHADDRFRTHERPIYGPPSPTRPAPSAEAARRELQVSSRSSGPRPRTSRHRLAPTRATAQKRSQSPIPAGKPGSRTAERDQVRAVDRQRQGADGGQRPGEPREQVAEHEAQRQHGHGHSGGADHLERRPAVRRRTAEPGRVELVPRPESGLHPRRGSVGRPRPRAQPAAGVAEHGQRRTPGEQRGPGPRRTQVQPADGEPDQHEGPPDDGGVGAGEDRLREGLVAVPVLGDQPAGQQVDHRRDDREHRGEAQQPAR